jgi:GGDEF domain-containing protein
MPCRYESEAFTIILPDTALKQGIRFANRLRLIIEKPPAKTSDALLGIEVSFEVEVYKKGDELTEKEYVEKVATKSVTLPLKVRTKAVQLRRSFMQKALART